MTRVKGTVRDGCVVLDENAEVPPDGTRVEVLVPAPRGRSLKEHLEYLLKNPPADVMSDEEIVEIVHRVRARRR